MEIGAGTSGQTANLKNIEKKMRDLERKLSRAPKPHETANKKSPRLNVPVGTMRAADLDDDVLHVVRDKSSGKSYIAVKIDGVIKKIEIT